MILVIDDPRQLLDGEFSKWLLRQVKILCTASLPKGKVDKWNEYLNNSTDIPKTLDIDLDAIKLLKDGIQNIICEHHPGRLIYRIDKRVMVFGVEGIRLESICKLINYGNTTIKGTHTFTKAFAEFETNIDDYIDRYMTIGI